MDQLKITAHIAACKHSAACCQRHRPAHPAGRQRQIVVQVRIQHRRIFKIFLRQRERCRPRPLQFVHRMIRMHQRHHVCTLHELQIAQLRRAVRTAQFHHRGPVLQDGSVFDETDILVPELAHIRNFRGKGKADQAYCPVRIFRFRDKFCAGTPLHRPVRRHHEIDQRLTPLAILADIIPPLHTGR